MSSGVWPYLLSMKRWCGASPS